MVTGDTFGYHLALAHNRPVVLLLGPSNGAEVIPKHVSTITPLRATLPCAPCARQIACGGAGGCMDTITPEAVASAVAARLGAPRPIRPTDSHA
jgi:heptosyltransferase-2